MQNHEMSSRTHAKVREIFGESLSSRRFRGPCPLSGKKHGGPHRLLPSEVFSHEKEEDIRFSLDFFYIPMYNIV